MLTDKGGKPFAFPRQPFHMLNVFVAGAGVSIRIDRPGFELHKDRIAADLIGHDSGVAIEIPVSFHETSDHPAWVRSLACCASAAQRYGLGPNFVE